MEQVQPESLLTYRWHPYAAEPGVDSSQEPTTLAEIAGGTQVPVVESGFDHIPLAPRATAYRMNDEGWAEQFGTSEHSATT